jgi:uncharacterized membrane protein
MAFVGWIIEAAHPSCNEKKIVNVGFLSGPFLPIYEFGAVIITSVRIEAQKFPEIASWAVTLLSPTALEYFGSWIMEKILKLKLWDYSSERLHLNGGIYLKLSVMWAFLAMAHALAIQPLVFKRIMALGPYYSHFIAGVLAACFARDVNCSIRSLLHFKDFQNNIRLLIEKGKKFMPAF